MEALPVETSRSTGHRPGLPPRRRAGLRSAARLVVAMLVTVAVAEFEPVHVAAAVVTTALAGTHVWRHRRWLLGTARNLPRGRVRRAVIVDFTIAVTVAVLFLLTVGSGLVSVFDPDALNLHRQLAIPCLLLGLVHGLRHRLRRLHPTRQRGRYAGPE